MILTINHSEFYNDVCESIRTFFPDASIILGENGDISVNVTIADDRVISVATSGIGNAQKSQEVSLTIDNNDPLVEKRVLKRAMKLSVYRLMVDITGKQQPWGSLTGIRPTKMIYDSGISYKELEDVFGVSEVKSHLL